MTTLKQLKQLEKLRREDLKRFTTEELRELLETLQWWKGLKRTNNVSFLPLFFDSHRYLVLKGGGGSGKSIFAGRKVLERCISEPGHRFLVCRKVGRTLRDSCFAQLRQQLADHYPDSGAVIYRGDMRIVFPNGSEILFAGLDDVEKLKSIFNITGIWIEEASELMEEDFNQLDIRLRTKFSYYLQIILSFNPISINHWLKKRFFDFDIKNEAERKKFIARTRVHESTYKDNRFLIREAIETLEAFKHTDQYYYMVYCLGQWGVTGKTVFDGVAISRRLEQIKGRKVLTGYFQYDEGADGVHISNWRFVEDTDGPVKIFREPEAGRPYVIGGDTAGDGSDWFVGQVLDNVTGRQAAKLRHQCDEDVYARQMYCLGMHYDQALLGVETNFSTFPVKELTRLGYHRQFVREREDTYKGSVKASYGFRTDALTRPVIISGLIEALRGHYELLEDRETLEELLTFVRDPKSLRPQAEAGAHDDCVMALAIAFYIRPQQSMEGPKEERRRVKWTHDMWEDYYGADEAGRQYLVAKWGEPER